MNLAEIEALVALCEFESYEFAVSADNRGAWFLQASYDDRDIVCGEVARQDTRRWFLSPQMTKSEVVQTVFKCVATSMEHRAREGFQYRGRRVFGPHFDVDALWSICGQLDYRDMKRKQAQPTGQGYADLVTASINLADMHDDLAAKIERGEPVDNAFERWSDGVDQLEEALVAVGARP